jgi:hypothetical protein
VSFYKSGRSEILSTRGFSKMKRRSHLLTFALMCTLSWSRGEGGLRVRVSYNAQQILTLLHLFLSFSLSLSLSLSLIYLCICVWSRCGINRIMDGERKIQTFAVWFLFIFSFCLCLSFCPTFLDIGQLEQLVSKNEMFNIHVPVQY